MDSVPIITKNRTSCSSVLIKKMRTNGYDHEHLSYEKKRNKKIKIFE